MRDAWFIVEIYCFLIVIKGISHFRTLFVDPLGAAIGICSALIVAILSFFTFRGSRIASRALVIYIMFGVLTSLYSESLQKVNVDVYALYRWVVTLYFFVGAIRLWRVKELPTRFTDPDT